jgi:hypothetical protein
VTPADLYVWIRPEEIDFLQATREALAIERRAYAVADAGRKRLLARLPGWENLTLAQQADLQAHVRGLTVEADTYLMPAHGWTCFHCGETFRTPGGARLHFGPAPTRPPVCVEVVSPELELISGRLA